MDRKGSAFAGGRGGKAPSPRFLIRNPACAPAVAVGGAPLLVDGAVRMAVIGVDFGTTNSVVTRLAPDGSVETVRHAFGVAEMDVIRSVLCFWNEGAKARVGLRQHLGP